MTRTIRIAVLIMAAVPALLAHPGHGESGFVAGAVHPLTGLDHILAMIAVGLLAVRCRGHALWVLPATFVASMVLGGLLGVAGVGMPLAEWGIALSVLVFGSLIALSTPPRTAIAAGVIGVFALMHGHAHAQAMAGTHHFAVYAAGFVLVTVLLHVAGISSGLALMRLKSPGLVQLSGGLLAASSIGIFCDLMR